ncbi:MAG: nickel pincer cofactor biosynthesis protein LarC [Desulfomonilaceae bacterium]
MLLAYFDCFSGISGDMTLAALIDLGLDQDYLSDQLATLKLGGYSLNIRRSSRRGISGIRFDVEVVAQQPHRGYRDIRDLIEQSGIHETAKIRSLEIFEVIAQAEARVHGTTKEEVHFHEVGAVDSIIDIVGAAVGIHRLGISEIICSPLPLSRGFVETAHGTIPTPAPATLEILEGVPVRGVECPIELVTPTGAAIARALTSGFGPYPSFVPLKTGYGLGKSDPQQFPNALRVTLGREADHPLSRDQVSVVECQVDDLDPRVLGDLMELLLSRGALDVTFTSVQMKKNRPGTLVSAVIAPPLIREISEILLTHTTTLGVRVSYADRIVLERRSETVQTSLGPVRVKVVGLFDGRTEKRPEFDDVRAIARRTGRPSREILLILDRELSQ